MNIILCKKFLINLYEKNRLLFIYYRAQSKYTFSVMSPAETISYIKNEGCSIARFGDGEFSIMFEDQGPDFQEYSNSLSRQLQNVFDNRSKELLICIPKFLVNTKGVTKEGKKFWRGYIIRQKKEIASFIKEKQMLNYHFGDSFVSRPFSPYKSIKNAETIFPLWKQLWKGKDVLIVEGELTRLGVNNDLFANTNSIKRILVPSINAFECYYKILESIMKNWSGELVLLAIGPTATVLAAELSQYGIQALDIGHIDIQYEWYLNKEPWKAVAGKYVNESSERRVVEDCKDIGYLTQIIDTINK